MSSKIIKYVLMFLVCFLSLTHSNLSCAEYIAFIQFLKIQIIKIHGQVVRSFCRHSITKETDTLMNLTEGDKVYRLHYLLAFSRCNLIYTHHY